MGRPEVSSEEAAAAARQRPRPGAVRPSLRFWLTVCFAGLVLAGIGGSALLVLPTAQERALADARARVDKGLVSARRNLDDRLARLGDQAELLAHRPAVVEAFVARDMPALNEALVAARSQFGGSTTAAVVVDETGHSIAEQPPRALYDYSQFWTVRTVLRQAQPPWRPRMAIEARRTATNPLSELGLAAAFPIVVEGKPAGAILLLRVFNDSLMNELATMTGLDVAVLTSDSLLAGSRDVRDLFLPPRVRPPAQRLAPVEPLHLIGEQTYVAAADALRSWQTPPSMATPAPTPRGGLPGGERPGPSSGSQGQYTVATLFVGLKEGDVLRGVEQLRLTLAGLLAAGGLLAVVMAAGLARAVTRPLGQVAAGLSALAGGREPGRAPAGSLRETAALAGAFNAMNRTMTVNLQTLRDERRKLEAVIHSVTQGIIVLDNRSRLVTVNETAQHLLGLPAGLPPGSDLLDLLTPQQAAVLGPAVQRRDRFTAEINLDAPRQAIVHVAAVPVTDDFARPLGRAIVLQDVTEERLLDNVKADFFTAMSHELRTPLSAISGAAEVLLDDELSPTQQRFMETIHRNADRLGRLVTDLLDLSKLESRRVELRLARVDLNEIVADAVAALEPVAAHEGQRLRVQARQETLPLTADHGRLEQIVTNLISNALKYTPPGGEVVATTWTEGEQACLAVSDNGVGISTVDQQHLFDKFYQGVNALTHKQGGSGLGLTIVKHLTELHGGRISVQSRLGAGSTFTVRLPLKPPVGEPGSEARSEPGLEGKAAPAAAQATPAADGAERAGAALR